MTVSIAVPQIFYDLIARVIPGFLFLLVLGFELSGIVDTTSQGASSGNSVITLVVALIFVTLSYLMGWVLYSFTFLSARERIRAKHELVDGAPSVSEKYDWIRIEDEAIGFRITKLRAEARMLETSRTGMVLVLLFAVSLLLLSSLTVFAMPTQPILTWIAKLGIPFVLAAGFWKSERPAWSKFYSNVVSHYELLTRMKSKKQPELPAKPKAA